MADFNDTPFPAWPGTRIADEDGLDEPVIGWVQTDNGLAAITLDGQMRMIGDYVVTLADGTEVESPVRGAKKSRADTAQKTAQAPVQTSILPSIEWTSKTFKTNSWWRYVDGSFDFILEVPAEQYLPKASDEMVKIKRTEFVEMKKAGHETVIYIDAKEGRFGDPDEAPEPEPEIDDDDEDLI